MITNYSEMSRIPLKRLPAEALNQRRLKTKNQASWGIIALLLMLCLMPKSMIAQSSANYAFATNATGSLTLDQNGNAVSMGSGTTPLVGAGLDATASGVTNIGFDYYFMGTRFTQFSVQEDGILQLGATAVGTNVYTLTGGTLVAPRLSAFNADMRTGTTTGKIHYKLVGTAPNRALIVEFTDMQLFYTASPGTAGTSTWQMRLYENGNLEYVYGVMSATNIATSSRAPSIGFYVGATTGNFASVLYATNTNSTSTPYAANGNVAAVGDIANLNSTADGSRRVYSYAPSVLEPANPTTLTFPTNTAISTTLSWVDNSTNEFAFLVTRATDAAFTANVVTATVLSTTSVATGTAYTSVQTGLSPSTQYYYKVVAIQEGPARLTGLTGSATTLATGTISAVASGNWSDIATWSSGAVPSATDDVIIPAGIVVTEDVTAATAYSLAISGDLVYAVATARTLTVGTNVTINAGGSFKSAASGTVITHSLVVGGNLINNGTLDFSAFTTSGANITFNTAISSNFTLGATSITNLRAVTLSKGTNISSVLTFAPAGTFTVQGANTSGFLTILNGLFKLDGTTAFSNPLFGTAAYTIPSTGGLWLNNPNATILPLAGSPTFSGLFRISDGTFNIGTATGNSVGFSSASTTIIEGGTINAASRFGVGSAGNTITYTQSGGTINVNQIGNVSTSLGSFDLGTSATSVITITGGTVNVVLANTGASGPRDVRGTSVFLPILTGGTINFGTAASGAAKTFYLSGNVPNFVINNASAVHSVSLSATASTFNSVTIPVGSVLNLNAFRYIARGANLTNDGTITGTLASSDLYFFSTVPQTYTGSGVITPGLASLSIDNSVTIASSASGFSTLRVNLFSGTLINSNKVTIGTGAAIAAVVQIGATGATTPGGSFDVAPIFNLGTGTYSVVYQPETAQRTVGFEIPATRTVTNVTVNNTNGVVTAGGNLEVSGTLTLTAGVVTTTDANSLTLGTATAAGILSGGSVTSYINGPLNRTFLTRTATGTYSAATLFPVGKAGAYLPMYIDPTVTGPVTMSGEAFGTNTGTPGGGVVTLSPKRWEALVKSGSTNFTNSFVRLSDAAATSTNKILQAPTAAGAYASILPATTFATGILTTATPIVAANYTGFFAYGDLNICPAPTTQATAFVASNVGGTFLTGSFAAATGTPSHYLVVRYPAGAVVTTPVDYTTYVAGGTLGLGTIAAVLTAPATTFTQTGLTLGTAYEYYIYSYNNVSCYGPSYNVTTPLIGAVSTCAAATVVPTALAASNSNATGFNLSWTAGATDALELDIATNSTFTNFVAGYNAKPLAAGITSEIVTGLTVNTPYYVRIRAIAGTCYSANSSTLIVYTECAAEVAPTAVQTFADYTGAAPAPSCWIERTGTLAATSTLTGSTSAWTSSTGFANVGTNVGVKINLYGAKNDWFISNPIDLGTTPKKISFDMAVTSFNGTTAQPTLASHKVDIVVSTDGGATWSNANIVKTYTGAGTYSNTGQTEVVNLIGYSGIVKVAFVATTTVTTLDIDFHIDNFKIEAVTPPTITSFASTVACGDSTVLTITGTSLSGAAVTINGTPFTPTSVTGTQIVIPVNTSITGNIVITTPGGSVTSATPFTFTTAPALTLSATSAAICNGSSSSLVTVTAGLSDYTSFVWTPATGVTGTAATGFTFNAAVSNVYTLNASQSAGSCARTLTFNLTVNPTPSAVTIAPTSAGVCLGTTQALTATGGSASGSNTVGTAVTLSATNAQPTAFCNRFDHYWSQMVFTAAELTAAGVQAGNINAIKFNITSVGSAPNVTDFKVYMGTTTASVLTAFTTTGLTQVFNAATYTQVVGVNTITFSTPYQWNGTSNLIVDVRQTGIDSSNNSETYFTATSGNTVVYAITSTVFTGGSDGFANSAPTPTANANRLNTTFDWSNSAALTWAPVTDLFTDAAATVPYTGTPATTVYVKGSASTPANYVATASNTFSCTSSASVGVTVSSNPAPVAVSPQGGTTLANFVITPSTGITWYSSQANALAGTGALPLSTPLVDGTVYYATHTATCVSLPIAVTADTDLSSPSFNLNTLKYYPNPVNNILTVSYSESITGLKLFNMVGQQLMNKTVNSTETQLDMSNLPAGSYLLEVSVGSKSKMVKLLKNQ